MKMIQVRIKAEKENSKRRVSDATHIPPKNFKGEKANGPLRTSLLLKSRKEKNEWREFQNGLRKTGSSEAKEAVYAWILNIEVKVI